MADACNILFILADQFRRDALGVVGGYARTHALDALAQEGVVFRKVITNAPECVPARFALATGLYPHQSGVWQNGPGALSTGVSTWMKALVDAGYRTSLFGKTHFHEAAQPSGDLRDGLHLMRGYGLLDVDEIAGPRASMYILSNMTARWQDAGVWELYRRDYQERFATKPYSVRPSPLGFEFYYDHYVGCRAVEYLANYNRSQPWFCWVSFAGPHEPWDAPSPYDAMYDPRDMPMPIRRLDDYERVNGLLRYLYNSPQSPPLAPEDVAAMRANYAGNVTLIDDEIGAIFAAIKARGEYDNTLIIFTSDHGEMNGDHGLIYKQNFLAPAVEIPLIIRPPKGSATLHSVVSDALVELMDVGATIADYADVSVPKWSHARSLRPLLERKADGHRPFVVSEFAGHTMVSNERWKAEFAPDGKAVLLFDREVDLEESRNLVDHPNAETALGNLRHCWRTFLQQTSESREIIQ